MKKIFAIILIAIFIGLGVYIYILKNKNEKLVADTKKERIKNDSLVKVKDGLYEKLVADTLTKKELNKKLDSFGIKLKEAKMAQKIVIVPKVIEKVVEKIVISDTTIIVEDYYPQKKDYFTKHTTKINTKDSTAIGKFEWGELELRLGIGQQKDGTYKIVTKVPEFLNITELDIETLPINNVSKDNFGFLVGGSYGKDFSQQKDFFRINGGVRYKKLYLVTGINTNGQVDLGINIEL